MTAHGTIRSAAIVLAAAVLWSVPITDAQARGYHPNPPRHAPAPPQGASGSQGQDSRPQQASPGSDGSTPDHCFRNYDERCQRARENRNGAAR